MSSRFRYPFFKGFLYQCVLYGLFGGVLGNQGPLIDTRRLSRVRPPDQGVTILLVSKLTIFNVFFYFYMSPPDIGCYSYKLYRLT